LLNTANAAERVSIVVACRNEINHLRLLLESILAQDMEGIAWEAVIADGMSDDGTALVLEEHSARHPQLRAITNPGRIVSTGLNTAIKAARGEIIIRMDAHTSYAADYCRLCMETLERTGADNVGGPARTKAAGARARAVAAAFHSRFSTGGAHFHDPEYEGWVDTVPYGCWRKETLKRVGMFDETLVRNQDDELNLRLLKSGGRIWQNPAIVSWYSPRSTFSSLARQYFQYGFWKVAVIRKHRLLSSWRHAVPVAFILTNCLLLGMVAFGLAQSASWLSVVSRVWAVLAAIYGSACLTASMLAAVRYGWITLPYLPAAFVTVHLSFGVGFFVGLINSISRSGRLSAAAESAFTRISR
jgi:succinoglycan biosynthesis protein ExoA